VAKDLARNYFNQGKKCWRKYGLLKKYAIKGLCRAADLGMTKVILKIDAAILADALKSSDVDQHPRGVLFRNIPELMYHCEVSVCSRSNNLVADCLVAYGACNLIPDSQEFMSQTLNCVEHLASSNKLGANC
jgi:hypothetical protein